MVRGKRIGEREREIVIAARKSGESYKKAAEAAGISESAARRICLDMDSIVRTEAEKDAETKGREKFIDDAWEIIIGSVRLIKKRLRIAEADVHDLMRIIEDVVDGKDIDDKAKNKLLWLLEKQAREMTVPSLKELAGVVNVMYDKQALLSGEATENVQLTSEDMKLIAAVSEAMKEERSK